MVGVDVLEATAEAVVVVDHGHRDAGGAHVVGQRPQERGSLLILGDQLVLDLIHEHAAAAVGDRKSTRLNSSHVAISYAVFCLKKKHSAQLHDGVGDQVVSLTPEMDAAHVRGLTPA